MGVCEGGGGVCSTRSSAGVAGALWPTCRDERRSERDGARATSCGAIETAISDQYAPPRRAAQHMPLHCGPCCQTCCRTGGLQS